MFPEKIDLNKFGHAQSPQIKELHFVREINPLVAQYKVYTKWPGASNLDNYCQITYTDKENSDPIIDAIDFDGGPYLYIGFKLNENLKIESISSPDNFNTLFVYVTTIS